MGNSALKCFRGRGKVRLVLLNGDIAEFEEPVRASTVMEKYPRHVILRCSGANNRGTGQRRKISALRPEQALKQNEKYMLAPTQATRETLSAAISMRFYAKTRRKGSPTGRAWIQRVLDKVFKTLPWSDGEATKPLLGSNRHSFESRTSEEGLGDWRPSLDCIPESPTHNSHSPQS